MHVGNTQSTNKREGCSKMVQTNSRQNRHRTPSRELAIRGVKRREEGGLEGKGRREGGGRGKGTEEEGRKEEAG